MTAALALLICLAGIGGDTDQTKLKAGTQDMIQIPASPKLRSAVWPRPGAPDYTFVVHSRGGQELGSNLREFDWKLQVDSRPASVSLEYFRSDADIPGTPIGLFRMSIDDDRLRELRKLIADVKLFEIHPVMDRHPGYTSTAYWLVEPPKDPAHQQIYDNDERTNATLGPLSAKVNSMLAAGFAHPERAALAGLRHMRQPQGDIFEVSLKNIGVEKICLTDPTWVVPSGPLQQAVVMVAEFPEQRPGESDPLVWKSIPLKLIEPRPAREPLVTLQPGDTWTGVTGPWKAAAGKRYLAYFTLANFAGDPVVGGVYRIRGRADSPRVVIAP